MELTLKTDTRQDILLQREGQYLLIVKSGPTSIRSLMSDIQEPKDNCVKTLPVKWILIWT